MNMKKAPIVESDTTTKHERVVVAHQDDDLHVISGKVSALYVTEGGVNLLQGMQRKMAAAGMAAVIQDMSGSVANSAMLSMYEGECVQHFGCYLADQMVIGTFETIDFKEGEFLRAVVSRLDDKVCFAHAVVRPGDGLLWMPFAISKGRWMAARWMLIACLGVALFTFLIFGIFYLFDPWRGGFLARMGMFAPVFIGVSAFICGGAYWSGLDDAKYAERIIKVLGFKRPSIVNLSPFSEARLRKGASYMVYDLRAALKAYDSFRK